MTASSAALARFAPLKGRIDAIWGRPGGLTIAPARAGGQTAAVMISDRPRHSSWILPLLVWFAVLAAAFMLGEYATPTFAGVAPGGRPMARIPPPPSDLPSLLFQLGVGSTLWYVAVASLPLLMFVARRVNFDRWGRAGTVAFVAGGTCLFIVLTSVIDYSWTYSAGGPPVAAWIPISLRQHVMPWIALVGIVAALEARRRAVRATIERERLRAQVAEQRLIALAGQLRPHFLFNALQAVSTLIHRDPAAADATLTKLSDLLHDVLRHRDSPYVRLAEEARYARTWLEIAKVRFADRLSFEIDVPSDLENMLVPLFILQPLVENALGHGIGGVIGGGHVTVRARRDGSQLMLEVIDDGAGMKGRTVREGIGLANTRERLKAAFDDRQRLTVSPGPVKGTVARIEMPANPAGVTEALAS